VVEGHQAGVKLLAWLAVAVLIFAAASDVRRRLIPNRLVLVVLTLGLGAVVLGPPRLVLLRVVLSMGIFAVLAGLALRGIVGGGDAKLMPAVMLLTPLSDAPRLLVLVAVCGGLLSLLLLAAQWAIRHVPTSDRLGIRIRAQVEEGVPYGVAIAGGFICELLLAG